MVFAVFLFDFHGLSAQFYQCLPLYLVIRKIANTVGGGIISATVFAIYVYIYLKNYYLTCASIIAFCLLNSCQFLSNEDSGKQLADNSSKEQYIEPQVANTVVASDESIVASKITKKIKITLIEDWNADFSIYMDWNKKRIL